MNLSMDWIYDASLQISFKDKTPLLLKDCISLDCDWDYVHQNINENTIWLGNGSFIVEELSESDNVPTFNTINIISNTLKEHFDPRTGDVSTHMYCSLTSLSKTLGDHMDTADVFFCGAIGQTVFEINDRKYTVTPGDVLYIPRSVNHNPKPKGARVGFSIGLEHGRHDT